MRTFTVAELQERAAVEQGIEVSRDSIYEWLRSGELIGYKLGGKSSPWRIDEADWVAFLRSRRARMQAELVETAGRAAELLLVDDTDDDDEVAS